MSSESNLANYCGFHNGVCVVNDKYFSFQRRHTQVSISIFAPCFSYFFFLIPGKFEKLRLTIHDRFPVQRRVP